MNFAIANPASMLWKARTNRRDGQRNECNSTMTEAQSLQAVEHRAIQGVRAAMMTTSIRFFAFYFSSRPTTVKNTWRVTSAGVSASGVKPPM